jgi:acyl carrier protein
MNAPLEELIEIVCLQFGAEAARAADHLQEDLQADSADILNLVVAIEDRFAITLSEEDVAGLATVGDLHRLVERKVGE